MMDYNTHLRNLEKQYALPDGYLSVVRHIESSDGKNSPATGAHQGDFQFDQPTAAAVGLQNRNDPYQAAEGAAKLAVMNRSIISGSTGIPANQISGQQLYLAHQQGGRGAADLLTKQGARVGDLVGDAAITGNGGDPNATAADYTSKWYNQYNKASGVNTATAAAPGVGSDTVASMRGPLASTAPTGGLLSDLLGTPGGSKPPDAPAEAPVGNKWATMDAIAKAVNPQQQQQPEQQKQSLIPQFEMEQQARFQNAQGLMASLLQKGLLR